MKKIIKLLIIFSLSLVTLSGCTMGEKNKDSNKKDSNSSELSTNSDKKGSVSKAGTEGNENYNLANNGHVDTSNGWIYYSLNDGLYRAKENGKNKERILKDESREYNVGNDIHVGIRHINVIGDWIYFNQFGLCRIKTDGSSFEQFSGTNTSSSLHIVDGKIYEGVTYKMDLDTTNKKRLFSSEEYDIDITTVGSERTINVTDKNIFFCNKKFGTDEKEIIKSDLDGKNVEHITSENVRTNNMVVSGDWIYYIYGDRNIYRIRTNGKDNHSILKKDSRIGELVVRGDKVYYTEDKKLCVCNGDGSDDKVIADINENYPFMQLHDDWIYYYQDSSTSDTLCRIKIDGTHKEVFASEKDEYKKIKSTFTNDNSQKLNHYVTTEFSERTKVSFPDFKISYPSKWYVYMRRFGETEEAIELRNEKGTKIEYVHYIGMIDNDTGGSAVSMSRDEVKKIKSIKFKPSYVQAEDYSDLGDFVIADIKTTGEMDRYDSDYRDFDGAERIAIIPSSKLGTNEDVRLPDDAEYGFIYGDCISIIATPSNGKNFTEQEKKEVINILSSFNEIQSSRDV